MVLWACICKIPGVLRISLALFQMHEVQRHSPEYHYACGSIPRWIASRFESLIPVFEKQFQSNIGTILCGGTIFGGEFNSDVDGLLMASSSIEQINVSFHRRRSVLSGVD